MLWGELLMGNNGSGKERTRQEVQSRKHKQKLQVRRCWAGRLGQKLRLEGRTGGGDGITYRQGSDDRL